MTAYWSDEGELSSIEELGLVFFESTVGDIKTNAKKEVLEQYPDAQGVMRVTIGGFSEFEHTPRKVAVQGMAFKRK